MTVKQIFNSNNSPDGSTYGTLTDGSGNLVIASTTSLGPSSLTGKRAPDGSVYFTLTDGNGNLV